MCKGKVDTPRKLAIQSIFLRFFVSIIPSVEVVLPNDCSEVVFRNSLPWSSHMFELSKSLRIMNTLFKQVKFRFTYPHLTIETEQAFPSIVERIKANRLECKISRVTSENIKSLSLTFLRVLGSHRVVISLFFIPNDFLSAFVEINICKYQTL